MDWGREMAFINLSFSETRSESARPHDGPGFSDPQHAVTGIVEKW